MSKAEAERYTMVCADHRLPLNGDGTCPIGHKALRFRRLDRQTNALGPVTRTVDPASPEGKSIGAAVEARTRPVAVPAPARIEPKPIAQSAPPKLAAEPPPPAKATTPEIPARPLPRKAADIVRAGVYTDVAFAEFAQAVMLEVIEGDMPPAVAVASLSAADKLLKIAEMRLRRGLVQRRGADGGLLLVGPDPDGAK